jgi:DNA (cytosine-5)-methyltransferase 1
MKLGSLFSGAGGFELAARMAGITPVWASEIERFPIAVTAKNFPGIKHLGDVKNINGAEVEPVDIITFGSPCQDLSIAGKRFGLGGERSGLFGEAIRIVKEMRRASGGVNPRFVIWENVPGAFSSSDCEDFRTVLEEIVRIKFATVSIPRPSWGWTVSGLVMGDNISVAWRTLDAQYWGVPQRRRRIFLVADFAGRCAGEILFDSKSLQRNTSQSGGAWKDTTANSQGSAGETICFEPGASSRLGGHYWTDVAGTLRAENDGDNRPAVVFENHPHDRRMRVSDKSQTLTSRMGTGGNNVPMTFGIGSYNSEGMKSDNPNTGFYEADTSRTLDLNGGNPACHQGGMAVVSCAMNAGFYNSEIEKASTLMSRDYKDPQIIIKKNQYLVRRLTPTECGHLQGFPDGWCDGIPHSDAAEYKMWGNSLAVPCAFFVMSQIKKWGEKDND